MASKELRVRTGDSSTSSDSSSSDDDEQTSMEEEKQDTSMEEEQQDVSMEEVSPKSMPPKMRIKLSLRMPKKSSPGKSPAVDVASTAAKKEDDAAPVKKRATKKITGTPSFTKNDGSETGDAQDTSPPSSSKNEDETENEDEEVMQATIVNTKEEGTSVDAVANVAETTKPKAAAAKKKRAFSKPLLPTSNTRTVRLPPLASPGMLLPPSAGVFRGDADANGYTTPASVFDHCMKLAGYTTQARTEHPHRGSSVQRQVGDMFDSDVSFAVNFPPLVPKELWSLSTKKDQDEKKEAPPESSGQEPSTDMDVKEAPQRDAAQLLLRALAPTNKREKEQDQTPDSANDTSSTRKRRRPWQFSEMSPLSLTLPYPESYIQKRLQYAEKVKERERAIVISQEAKQKYQDAQDRYELLSSAKRNTEELPPPPVRPEPTLIPPIPEPISPPRITEMEGEEYKNVLDDSKHPIYLPKTHEQFTSHLDPACFDITNGRYFGALTNSIADPNFVGPNAPGLATAYNFAGGSGLATAYTGSTSGGSAAFLTSASAGSGFSKPSTSGKSTSKKKATSAPTTAAAVQKPVADTSAAANDGDATGGGPPPTSTSTALKKMMDEGGEDALQMKVVIVRAAVYASRVGTHTMAFVGSDGEVYPDVSKAFAAHGGVRPCIKCKNNKQGAYHCRLRRKHKALDYDGGDSPGALAPLFQEPLADLILTK